MNKLRLFIVINLIGVFYFQSVFAYGVETHAALTQEIIEFYNRHYPENPVPEDLALYLIDGSRREDDAPRWMNHFYDPVNDRGLESEIFGYGEKSKEWAQSEELQNQLVYKTASLIASILTAIQERKIGAITTESDFTWQRAVDFYLAGEKEKAFFTLGHAIHLIEDASVPDHTRNDPHPAFDEEDESGTGSPYELWTHKFTRETIDLSPALVDKKPVLLAGLDDYFDGLAGYSNNNFYSKDTIGIGHYLVPEPDDFERIGIYYYGVKKGFEGPNYFLSRQSSRRALIAIKDIEITLNDELVLQDYWDRLAVKSVQYGAGVIDLFFKEVAKKEKENFGSGSSLTGQVLGLISPDSKDDFELVEEIDLAEEQSVIEEPSQETNLPDGEAQPSVEVEPPNIEAPNKPSFRPCGFNTTQSPSRRPVIINEVAWMGTTASANDEWMELKNISGAAVNIAGWQVWDKAEQIKATIESGTIPAGGFYLLERTDDDTVPNIVADLIYVGALGNTDEGLRLFDANCNLIDEILASPAWPAGNNAEKRTLERDVINGLGWHTSSVVGGTPKAENTSVVSTTFTSGGGGGGSASSPQGGSGGPSEPSQDNNPSEDPEPDTVPNLEITDVIYDVEGSDDGQERIIFTNLSQQTADLSGFSVQYLSSSGDFGTIKKKNFDSGMSIVAGGTFTIGANCHSDTPCENVNMSWSQALNNAGGSVYLAANQELIMDNADPDIIDRYDYGSFAQAAPPEISAVYDPAALTINLSWPDSASSSYSVYAANSPLELVATTSEPGLVYGVSEVGRDYNFEVRAVDDEGDESVVGSATVTVPSFFDGVYFYEDPRNPSSTDYLVDLHWNDYPFVAKNLHDGGDAGSWHAALFYYNQEPPPVLHFDATEDMWGLNEEGGLRLVYPNCAYSQTIGPALIFPDSRERCSADYGGVRNLTLRWESWEDNHLLLNVVPGFFGETAPAADSDYITAAFYGYSGPNTQSLIAVDKNKYFFQENSPLQSSPSKPDNLSPSFNDLASQLSVSWDASADPDSPDALITYEFNYSTGVQLDDGAWQPAGGNLSYGFDVSFGNDYLIGVRAVDDFGNVSETAYLNWSFPPDFIPYKLSNSLNSAAQDFIAVNAAPLQSIQVSTANFTTTSRNPSTNRCGLDLYEVNGTSTALIASADLANPADGQSDAYAYRGRGCAGRLTFTYASSGNPVLEADKTYRWIYYFSFSRASVQFWGTDTDSANGLFSDPSIVNAKFIITGADDAIIAESP